MLDRRCRIGLRPGHEAPNMPTTEERLSSLEARLDTMSDLKTAVTDLRGDMNRQFVELRGEINGRFADLRGEMYDRLTELRSDMHERFAVVSARFTDMDRRFTALDDKGDRHFTWLVGTQVALLLAVFGALVGAYFR
jgi:uncharacterized coiled-coil protein SlyX